MKFRIYSFRYIDDKTYESTVDTYEEAVREIDRLAKARKEAKWYARLGDPVFYTFLPVGSDE